MSFIIRVLRAAKEPVGFVRCYDSQNRACYFYILADEAALARLEADSRAGPVDARAYGKIIASGFGHWPDEATRQKLAATFGLTFDFFD